MKIRINREEIKQGIVNAFKNLITDLGDRRASPLSLGFSSLSELDATRLEVPLKRKPKGR